MWHRWRLHSRIGFLCVVVSALTLAPARADRLLCVQDVAAPNALEVRAAPTAQSQITGTFPAAACGLKIVAPCVDGYCEMALAGVRGFVDTRKVAVHDRPDKSRVTPPPGAEPHTAADQPRGRCVGRVEPGDTLRIRTGPSAQHEEVGGIPARACGIEPVGGCQGSWCRIVWRGQSGWVNAYYLD